MLCCLILLSLLAHNNSRMKHHSKYSSASVIELGLLTLLYYIFVLDYKVCESLSDFKVRNPVSSSNMHIFVIASAKICLITRCTIYQVGVSKLSGVNFF